MKQTLNTSIEKINHLGRKSLEEYLVSEQTLPNSDEKVFNIGYALLKLDRLDEAYEDYNEDMENGIFNLLQNKSLNICIDKTLRGGVSYFCK